MLTKRRTAGRAEDFKTLEEQLCQGLEDSFPASDPPAVTSTLISGRCKALVGTEEHIRLRAAMASLACAIRQGDAKVDVVHRPSGSTNRAPAKRKPKGRAGRIFS